MSYDRNTSVSSFMFDNFSKSDTAEGFARTLCVVDKDICPSSVDTSETEAALLCDLYSQNTLYSKNAYEQLHPASLTKVMTALVALKYGNLDDELTASANVQITESGASLIGLKEGDKMTLSQALYCLLMPSGNDAAVLIAENIGGSLEGFSDLMNQEAKAIGATGSHFVNPHGLTAEDHYVTAYDMYLIFHEAMKYDVFTEIINAPSYSTIYYDKEGNPKEYSCETTNLFLRGQYDTPSQITVIGGKTGTTNAAQNCLVLLSKDTSGNPYISVILKCSERGILYQEMASLLELAGK